MKPSSFERTKLKILKDDSNGMTAINEEGQIVKRRTMDLKDAPSVLTEMALNFLKYPQVIESENVDIEYPKDGKDSDDNQVDLVVTFKKGDPLADHSSQKNPLGFQELVLNFQDLLCALIDFLTYGVLHGDWKPDNLVQLDWKLKLIDFGLTLPTSTPLSNYHGTLGYYPWNLSISHVDREMYAFIMTFLMTLFTNLYPASELSDKFEEFVLEDDPSTNLSRIGFLYKVDEKPERKIMIEEEDDDDHEEEEKENIIFINQDDLDILDSETNGLASKLYDLSRRVETGEVTPFVLMKLLNRYSEKPHPDCERKFRNYEIVKEFGESSNRLEFIIDSLPGREDFNKTMSIVIKELCSKNQNSDLCVAFDYYTKRNLYRKADEKTKENLGISAASFKKNLREKRERQVVDEALKFLMDDKTSQDASFILIDPPKAKLFKRLLDIYL